MRYSDYEGKRWEEIPLSEREILLSKAYAPNIPGVNDSSGHVMVQFCDTLAVMGVVQDDGAISVPKDAVLYNPVLNNGGHLISQEMLDEESKQRSEKKVSLGCVKETESLKKRMKNRPHVVILGAGASIAAIPDGDANGRKISGMDGFIQKLSMADIIDSLSLNTTSNNLEDIYMEMYERDDCKAARECLEKRIEEYFSGFEIPSVPTVYDFLVLSLRDKDLIATFNWDPLIYQAYGRCRRLTSNLPAIVFLHGNVAAGLCEKDKRVGKLGKNCPCCGNPYERIPLLYPIKNKDYTSNPVIENSWNVLQEYMQRAYILTIFGYSAPKTDVAAIDMLKNAWGSAEARDLEQIEIIDIRNRDDLYHSWSNFIHSHHYDVWTNIYDSSLGTYPRRTCDVLFDRTMEVLWPHNDKGFTPNMSFDCIQSVLGALLDDEQRNGDAVTDPYVSNDKT